MTKLGLGFAARLLGNQDESCLFSSPFPLTVTTISIIHLYRIRQNGSSSREMLPLLQEQGALFVRLLILMILG